MRIQNCKNRQGLTLVFVVSMIVLFLLMGTTFVIIANDYFKASRKRSGASLYTIDRAALVQRAFYDVVRGPSLLDSSSPFRAHDLLSDQYAYGFSAVIDSDPEFVAGTEDQFLQVTLKSEAGQNGVPNRVWDHDQADADSPASLGTESGLYNGLVFTFVSGPAKGFSTRIVNHYYDVDETNNYFVISTLGWLDRGTVNPSLLLDSEVVINGREFSGTGVGGAPSGTELGSSALFPNRIGESFADLNSNYLFGARHSPNESYDAADFQNMFLSGWDNQTPPNIIPSFHRKSLYDYNNESTHTPAQIQRYSFRPIYDPRGTGTANFSYPFKATELDVDTDGDGNLDSVFIDPGYGIISNPSGQRFKPLVAFRIVDLDGRLNVNAHGNLTQVEDYNHYISTSVPMLSGNTGLPRGQGYGPPEVSLANLFGAQYESLLWSRYGEDLVPGSSSNRKSTRKLFGYPIDVVDWANGRFGTVARQNSNQRGSLFASSAMDIHGRFAIGSPMRSALNSSVGFDNFRDPNLVNFTNGLPVIDMAASSNSSNEFDNNAYEMTFAPLPNGDYRDRPFTPTELERVLRQFDADSNVLPARLLNFATSIDPDSLTTDIRNLLTTDSFEVPVTPRNLRSLLLEKVSSSIADRMLSLDFFAPELKLGLKMDVNRPFGNGYDDNQDGVVDEPDEADIESHQDFSFGNPEFDLNRDGVSGGNGPNGSESNARVIFARHLYMLALLLTDTVDDDLDGDGSPDPGSYARMIAQWAVNVVDFRDPDLIMTRFQYDPNPWDGTWDVNNSNVVWGCERPEMLITETFGFHDRRTEDSAVGGRLGDDPPDPHYDNRLRPEAGAFIELYNPWTQNSLNQRLDPSLYVYSNDGQNQGIDLARKTRRTSGRNSSPVWRISVDRPDRSQNPDPEDTTPLRYVYFTDPTDGGNDIVNDDDSPGVEVFYSDFDATVVRPGEQAIIGSLGNEIGSGKFAIPMGRLSSKTAIDEIPDNLDLENTRGIILDPANGTIETINFDANNPDETRSARILPINLPRSFNVSDKFGGYNSDMTRGEAPIADGVRYQNPDGSEGGFDVPLDATTDVNRDDADLQYLWLNGETGESFRVIKLQRLANPSLPFDAELNPYITIDRTDMDLTGFNGAIRGRSGSAPDLVGLMLNGNPPLSVENNASHERGGEDKQRLLFKSGRATLVASTFAGDDTHYFDMSMEESLGKTNDAYVENLPNEGFAWLTWNNRPYVSHLELTNVPFSEPKWLTRSFSAKSNLNPYEGNDNEVVGRFGHLLNFFANESDAGGTRANMYRLMDYLEVPSRFTGTEQYLSTTSFPSPFNYLPRYRVPGKINVNTIYSKEIWDALQREFSDPALGVNWNSFTSSRNGMSAGLPTDFQNPFRPADKGVNVPLTQLEVDGPDCTLFRKRNINDSNSEPLFDFNGTNPANNSNRSAYFRNAQRQRLGNLVTTKSSVFAIWITVAYFEVDEEGRVGAEVGSDTGDIVRNRGFYVFDRSIPMAFEPGKNHNVERGILVQSIIE